MKAVYFLAVSAALLFSASGGASTIDFGVAPSGRKILPAQGIPAAKSASIAGARGEWLSFQVVLGAAGGAKNVDITAGDLAGPGGAVIGSQAFALFREHYLEIETASPISLSKHEREPGSYPDPLIPFADPYGSGKAVGAPFGIGEGAAAAVFIEVRIPDDAKEGRYTGSLSVTAGGAPAAAIPVQLDVWEFAIPAKPTVGTAFHFSESGVWKFHDRSAGNAGQILDNYVNTLHEHRMDMTHISGPVKFEFDGDGRLKEIDWTAYDAAVAPFMDGTRFRNGVGVAAFNAGYFAPGYGTGSMTADQFRQASKAFAGHLDAKGWWDKAYVYAIDEPWLNGGDKAYEQIKADATLLFEGSELWKGKVLVTSPFNETVAGYIGIWSPVTPMYEDWFYTDMPGRVVYEQRFKLGERLWFYVCNADFPPYAGYDIDSAIGHEPRIAKWGAWFEKATGFLYWSVDYWVKNDPWNVYADYDQFGPYFSRNGDGFLIYPGDHNGSAKPNGSPGGLSIDGPVVSYRMKQIRAGMQDWELFAMCDRLGGGDWARSQVARAYGRFGTFMTEDCGDPLAYCPARQPWTLDPQLLDDVREKVAEKILFLLYPSRYPDPENPVMPDGGTDSGAGDSGSADAGGGGEGGGCSCSALGL